MPTNTKVTVTYASGATREFVASDELEELINEGEMFSVTTMHSDMGINEEMSVSKMFAGNPMQALGNMMVMKHNAEKMLKEDGNKDMNIAIDIFTACIALLSEELTSYQSGMTPVEELPASQPCYYSHEDQCTHSSNIGKPCIGYILCNDYLPVKDNTPALELVDNDSIGDDDGCS